MFKKFTNSFNKVVGAGVIAAAGIASQDANAGLARIDAEPTIAGKQAEELYKNTKSIEDSLSVKFKKSLESKGYTALHIESTNIGDNKTKIEISFMGKEKATTISVSEPQKGRTGTIDVPMSKPETTLTIEIDKSVSGNKYLMEEFISGQIAKEIAPATSDYNYTDPTSSKPHYTDPISSTPNK